jgi:acetyl esterase/lipase
MNLKISIPLALVSFFFVYGSCSKNDTPETLEAKTLFNVAYASANANQKMDVYLPEGRSTSATKVLIAIHGGGWTIGDKSEMNGHIDSMRKRLPGYAIFNLNYRLSQGGNYLFPTPNNDIHEIGLVGRKRGWSSGAGRSL